MIRKTKRAGPLWMLRAAGALLMALALMGGCAPSAPPLLPDDAEYFGTSYSLELVRAVGERWGKWKPLFVSTADFVVDQAGNIVSAGRRTLAKFDPAGEWMWGVDLREDFSGEVDPGWVEEGLGPGIALDASQNIYVADSVAHRILKYTPAGDLEWVAGQLGEGPGEFKSPAGVAVDQAGSLYIADAGNRRVQKLDSHGDFIWAITSAEGYPSWIAVDEKAHLYVLDHRLWFEEDGTWDYSVPWSLLVFDTEGNLLHRLPISETLEDASFWEPPRVSLDRHRGHLYLINGDRYQESFSIRAIDPMSGQLLMNISRPVLEDHRGVHVPEGIYADGPRYLYYTLGSDLLQYRIVDAFVEARDKYLRGDYETADSLLSEIASISPSNPNALYYLGHSLEQLNQPDQAIVYYRMAAQLAPHELAGQLAAAALARLHPAPPARDPPNPPLIVSTVVLSLIAVFSRMVSKRQTGSIWEAVYRFGATFRTVTLLACLTLLPLILLVHGILSAGGPSGFATQRLAELEPWYLQFGWPGVVLALLPELILYGLPGLVVLAYGLSAWATQIGGGMRPWSEDDALYGEMLSCLRMAASRLGLAASNILVYTPRDPDEAYPGWRKAVDWLVRLAVGSRVTRRFEPFVFGRRIRDARLFVPQRLFQGGYLSRAEIEQVMIHELSHVAHGDVALHSWTRGLKVMIKRWFLILSGGTILRTLIQTYLLFPFQLWSLFAERSDASVPSPEYTQFVIRWVLTNQVAGAVIFLLWLVPFYLLLNALTSHTLRDRELAADIRAIGSSSDVAALKSTLTKIGLLERLHPPDKRSIGWSGKKRRIYVALIERARRLGKSFDPHPSVRQRLAVVSVTLEGEVRPLPSPSSVFFSSVASWFLSASLYGLLAIFPGSATPQSKHLSPGLLDFEIVPDQRWLWMAFGAGLVAIAWANLTGCIRLRRMDPKREVPWFGLLVRLLLAAAVYAFLWGVVPWALSPDVYATLSGFVPAQVDLYDLGRFVARSTLLRQALPALSGLMGRIYSPLTTLLFLVNLWALPFIYAFLALTLMALIWLSLPAKLLVPKSPVTRLGLRVGQVGVVVVMLLGVGDSSPHVTQATEANNTYVLDLRIQTHETVPGRRTWISDIQVDSQGNIYAAGDDQVYRFDSKGRPRGHIDLQPYLGESTGGRVRMALDRDGRLLAHQRPLPSLKWFDSEGQLIADVPLPAGRLSRNRYERPSIIHLDRRGDLSVNYGLTIAKYARTGRFALEFDPHRFYDYEHHIFLAFGPAGQMYFLDTEEQVIVQFDQFARPRLRFEGVVHGASDPESWFQASVDPHGNLYLTNTRADLVQMFNSQGCWVMDFELVNSSTGDRLDLEYGVKADNLGNLYAIGPNHREVLRFRLAKDLAVPADAEIVSRRLPRFHSSALFCSSSPPGAEVLLNDEEMGRTPLLIWNLVPGEHHVLLRSEAWSCFKAVNLTDGAIIHLDVDLAPDVNTLTPFLASRYVPMPGVSAWMKRYGDIELPTWRVTELALSREAETDEDALKAGILIDGQGRAYAVGGDRAAHSDVLTSGPAPLPAREPRSAILLISSIPEGATVHLNDVEIGRTPLLVGDLPVLPTGNYTVVVRSDTWEYHNSIFDTEREDFHYLEAKLR